MPEWKSDNDLFALCTRELYTPVVGDILDDLGFTHQFLPQPIQRRFLQKPFRTHDLDAAIQAELHTHH